MALRLSRSLAASSSSLRSYFFLGNRISASDITLINSGEFSDFGRALALYFSSSSTVIYSFDERKLQPELRGCREFVRSKRGSNSLFPCGGVIARQFSSETKRVNTKVNFSLSDDDDSDEETPVTEESVKPELPPPYDPFNKKPAFEEPEDPKNLQEIFHKMRTEGFRNEAVKMFDALSKDGLTHEALELFSQIKDKNEMPQVVAHTAIIEAYANAGQAKEALKVFMRMLSCAVSPNAYTYSVLIKGLARDTKTLKDTKKFLLEMMGKGMKPNAATYTAVFEAFVKEGKEDTARKLLREMKEKGFVVPDEKTVREALQSKRGEVLRTVVNILFDK